MEHHSRKYIIGGVLLAIIVYVIYCADKKKKELEANKLLLNSTNNNAHSIILLLVNKTVTAPVISTENTYLYEGFRATITATNVTGVCRWFKNGLFVADGSTLVVTSPEMFSVYTARCVLDGTTSLDSNMVGVRPAPILPPDVVIGNIEDEVTPA